ncbi:hypothetical protein PGT21_006094 [Puccinia graminis f. sp. tritici]|uniref:Uncharacterized protein n=1 Tax=Puccinia graminis f. sp. tritici TaxID=56615 RepID=A0A5B0SIN6_PUCGR|nr:hypothetical protein PGT21_006094 [Puccinia graminis f. sp. tritici]KAA1137762.1 hypothetical protein PGTUg99_013824 [Puccinia graminis f. sp. tritici]
MAQIWQFWDENSDMAFSTIKYAWPSGQAACEQDGYHPEIEPAGTAHGPEIIIGCRRLIVGPPPSRPADMGQRPDHADPLASKLPI